MSRWNVGDIVSDKNPFIVIAGVVIETTQRMVLVACSHGPQLPYREDELEPAIMTFAGPRSTRRQADRIQRAAERYRKLRDGA